MLTYHMSSVCNWRNKTWLPVLQFFKEHFKGAILAKFGLSNTRVYYICARFIAECQLDCLLLISRCKTKHIDYVSNVQYHMLKVCVHKNIKWNDYCWYVFKKSWFWFFKKKLPHKNIVPNKTYPFINFSLNCFMNVL